jgi:hypothetical protein
VISYAGARVLAWRNTQPFPPRLPKGFIGGTPIPYMGALPLFTSPGQGPFAGREPRSAGVGWVGQPPGIGWAGRTSRHVGGWSDVSRLI